MNRYSIHPSQLAILPENPTVEQAVEYMKTSMDILDWNLKRARVVRAVGRDAYLNHYVPDPNSYVARIDCSGLVVETLGKKESKNHKPFNYGKR